MRLIYHSCDKVHCLSGYWSTGDACAFSRYAVWIRLRTRSQRPDRTPNRKILSSIMFYSRGPRADPCEASTVSVSVCHSRRGNAIGAGTNPCWYSGDKAPRRFAAMSLLMICFRFAEWNAFLMSRVITTQFFLSSKTLLATFRCVTSWSSLLQAKLSVWQTTGVIDYSIEQGSCLL